MSTANDILEALYDLGQLFPRPLETKYAWSRRLKRLGWPKYYRTVRHLEDRGLVTITRTKDKKFLKLTAKGQLEALLSQAQHPHEGSWDGKWRLIIFDIPESQKDKRHLFRKLLKSNGFLLLQASVYINPYPLNRSAVTYLKQTGLIDFIRILRVDDVDDDKELRKKFNLK